MTAAKKKTDPAALARRYLRAKEAGKRNYKRSDDTMEQLVALGEKEIDLGGGKKARLIDKFKEKDGTTDKLLVWNPCAARRYDLEVVEP